MITDAEVKSFIIKHHPGQSLAWYHWYYIRLEFFFALHCIGLDYHGGPDALLDTKHVGAKKRFPTVGIIVCDPERASKYVDIGIRVDASLDIEVPKNMAEAAQRYLEMAALVDDQDGPATSCEELLESISACTDEHEKWCLRRELFRHRVKEKYEDLLIEKSQGSYLDKLERKRDYLNKLEREIETAKIKKKRLLKERLDAKFMEKMESIEEDNSFESHMMRKDHQQDLKRYHAYRKEKRLNLMQNMLKRGERNHGTPSVCSTASSED